MRVTKYLTPQQVRSLPNCKPDWKKAYKYAKLMEQGVEFPPVHIFKDKNGNLVYNDGRHRVTAAKMLGVGLKIKITE